MKHDTTTLICKTAFISDLHLGTRDANTQRLLAFLRDIECEQLFLVGDIIDGWELRRRFDWLQGHSDVIQKLLKKARKGTKITYILGNHDEFLRPFLPLAFGDHVTVCNETFYDAQNGKRYLIIHGDLFDTVTMTKKWLALLGDKSYLFLLKINRPLNALRQLFGYKSYWSLSKYAKKSVKKAVSYICDYEHILSAEAKQRRVDGVICGHIHEPEMKMIDSVHYLNCGDWVESCSALIEHYDGRFEIIDYLQSHHEGML